MAFNFKNDDAFPPKVKSGTLEAGGEIYYWLNGTGEQHSAFGKLAADDRKRHLGWEKAVFYFRCDEKGNPWYPKDQITDSEFHKYCDHAFCRDLGQLFLGLRDSEGNDANVFEDEVDQELKNSKKASGD